MTMKPIAIIAALALSACVAPPIAEYAPVVDPAKSGPRYQSDLAACRQIAQQAEAEYQRQQQQALLGNIIAGAIMGAAIGSMYGSDYVDMGAAYGATAGVAGTDTELAYGGPRRIIDRCMEGRGHDVLNDGGAGGG